MLRKLLLPSIAGLAVSMLTLPVQAAPARANPLPLRQSRFVRGTMAGAGWPTCSLLPDNTVVDAVRGPGPWPSLEWRT